VRSKISSLNNKTQRQHHNEPRSMTAQTIGIVTLSGCTSNVSDSRIDTAAISVELVDSMIACNTRKIVKQCKSRVRALTINIIVDIKLKALQRRKTTRNLKNVCSVYFRRFTCRRDSETTRVRRCRARWRCWRTARCSRARATTTPSTSMPAPSYRPGRRASCR
jgi:hypothetical protein